MKKVIILSCMVLLIANLLFGAILSFYGEFNVAISSVVIVVTGLLIYLTDIIRLKNGYKISLMLIFAVGGLLEFVLLIAPNRLTDNWWLILVIGLMAAEAILLIITNTVSNKIK